MFLIGTEVVLRVKEKISRKKIDLQTLFKMWYKYKIYFLNQIESICAYP